VSYDGVGVLPLKDLGDFEAFGEFFLPGGHAAESHVVFAMGHGALGINHGDFADSGEFFKQCGYAQVDASPAGDVAGEGGEGEGKHAIESVTQ